MKEKLWLQQHSAEIPGTELIYDFLFENRKDVVRREKDNQTEKCPSSAPPPQQRPTFSDESPTGSTKLISMVAKNIKRSDSASAQHLNAFKKMLRVQKVTRLELCKLQFLLEIYLNFTTKGLSPNILHTNNETI